MSSREKYKHGLEALCATHTQESIKQFNNDLSTLSTAFCIALEQEIVNKKKQWQQPGKVGENKSLTQRGMNSLRTLDTSWSLHNS